MRDLKALWKHVFDIREGEWGVTCFMTLYLMFVMFAYYVLKPVSNAMFLTELKVDKLPLLNVLIAAGGGTLAYLYTRFAVRSSLSAAVGWTVATSAACLAVLWWLIGMPRPWIMYVFNIWVSLFSAIIVSQAWLVAANLFDSRAAKRLYGTVGLGGVLGGSFGGVFTAMTARLIGSRNLLFAAIVLLGLAYAAFRLAISYRRGTFGRSTAAPGDDEFTFREVAVSISSDRHLRLIVALFSISLVVSTLADYQYKAIVTGVYKGNDLAAFFGRMNGIYLPVITIPLQFFLTAALVRRLGLGGTLAIMPAAVAAASGAIAAMPVLGAGVSVELAESSTRYTVNKTGMELLYLPQPARIRNRVKGFIDVFVDRLSRGAGGVLLMILLAFGFRSPRQVAVVSLVFCAVWIGLCVMAQREYVRTIRDRLAHRRLDFEQSRMNVSDPAVIRMLEDAAQLPAARAASYALSTLAEAPDYNIKPLLRRLSDSGLAAVRARVFEIASGARMGELMDAAVKEIHNAEPDRDNPAVAPAVAYYLAFSKDPPAAAKRLVDHPSSVVATEAVRSLRLSPAVANTVLTPEWVTACATDSSPARRELAAIAISVRGGTGREHLRRLLNDKDPRVCAAAFRAAAALREREYVDTIIGRLADPHLRRDAVEALAAFGSDIAGTLGDIMQDERVPAAVRVQIPRVFRNIPEQRGVDVLLRALDHADVPVRGAILKTLNHLRNAVPGLDYGPSYIAGHVLKEARYYCELQAQLATIAQSAAPRTATGLLARTLEDRASATLERLFRLLGLRYPPREIQAAYRSLQGHRAEETVAALDLLENVLEHSLRRVVLPLLEREGSIVEKGRDLFSIEVDGAESALRELIQHGDAWLVACAMATAAEQGLRELRFEIQEAAGRATPDVREVARSAVAALA